MRPATQNTPEANVRERLAWSYRRSGKVAQAEMEFAQAVLSCDKAARILAAAAGAHPAEREAALEREKVRRARCDILSGDPGHLITAKQDLAELSHATPQTMRDLYNTACLFAVAMTSPDLAHDRSRYAQRAWYLLGLALLVNGAEGPWGNVMSDTDLDALDAQQRRHFCNELKIRHPSRTPLDGEAARQVVEEAIRAIGGNL